MSYVLWLVPLLRFALPPIPLPAAFAPAAAVSAIGASVPAAVATGTEVITVTVAAPATPEFVIPWALLLTTAWLLGAVEVESRHGRRLRAEVLKELDHTIADMEKDAG